MKITENELHALLQFIIGISLCLTLTGTVFAVLYSLIFVVQPIDGQAGGGKTTLAKLIVQNLNCDYLYINASDERGIETIRDKVSGFASVASFKPLKVVILDEADFLTE